MKNLHRIAPSLDPRTLAVIWWFQTVVVNRYVIKIKETYWRSMWNGNAKLFHPDMIIIE